MAMLVGTSAGSALALEQADVEQLRRLVTNHARVGAAQADLSAAEASAASARGRWYPELRAGGSAGYSKRDNTNGVRDTGSYPRQGALTLTQPVLDFGRINSAVNRAELSQARAANAVTATQEDLLLEGLTARINLYRAARTVEFAQRSVDNIRKQTGMEQSRVDLGGGLATDVLQTKSQLAGAEARLVRSRSLYVNARNRFRAVFGEEAAAPARLSAIAVPKPMLPATLTEAIARARSDNATLRNAALTVDVAKADIRIAQAELGPRLNLVGETRQNVDIIDRPNTRGEHTVRLEFSYSLNSGLSSYRNVDAARGSARAAEQRLDDARMVIEEQVSNSWEGYAAARETADYLKNQARIAEEFLRLAREERQLGRRSLIDVLSGETALINAQSDAAAAEADIAIAGFSLLRSLGRLPAAIFPKGLSK
ncbi:TolC family protein [Paracraurococcus lichenis]|uniref:TolC family protein n=1 Tax=Paracraurococcus lichenis TaxID=3064888 RepID=A0ABT9E957_9PROT|nr:TolC family protein [Paracraurococcus sp. LOR1-02]MDO9712723.1 TolC family protein [Paracraurococcus sp. LOR1-02]